MANQQPLSPEDRALADEYLTLPRAARILGVHLRTVYRMIADGTLPYVMVGRRYRITRSALRAHANPNHNPQPPEPTRAPAPTPPQETA